MPKPGNEDPQPRWQSNHRGICLGEGHSSQPPLDTVDHSVNIFINQTHSLCSITLCGSPINWPLLLITPVALFACPISVWMASLGWLVVRLMFVSNWFTLPSSCLGELNLLYHLFMFSNTCSAQHSFSFSQLGMQTLAGYLPTCSLTVLRWRM